VRVRPLTAADAAAIASWHYPGRYSTYGFDEPPACDAPHSVFSLDGRTKFLGGDGARSTKSIFHDRVIKPNQVKAIG